MPGQLLGFGNVDLAVTSGEDREVFYLQMTNQPAIFAYPGTVPASSSAVPSGISYQLSYRLVPSNDAAFFSQVFIIPDYARSCPVKLYLRLTDTLGINWANFRSTCLGVRVGMLEFTSNLQHTVTFPGLSSPSPSVSASSKLVISSILTGSSLQLGNFFTLLPLGSGTSSLAVSFPSGSSHPTATLYNTNVTVFDNVINTAVSIQGSNMQFSGQTTIFGSYQVSVTGLSSTERRWSSLPLRYEGTIQGTFGAELNSYIADYITEEVNDVKIRRENAKASLNNSEHQLLTIAQKQNAKSLEHQMANDELQTLNSIADYFSMQAHQAELIYNQTLSSNSQAEQASMNINCTEQPCGYVCQPGVNCTTCYTNTQLVESGSCLRYETQSFMVKLSQPIAEQYWGYRRVCGPCFWLLRIGLFCIASKVQCCSTQCVSMIRYRNSYFYGTAYQTVSVQEPCVVNTIDTSTPSQCCMQYPCAYTVRDPPCVAANLLCEQQKQAAFAALGNAGEALSQSYAAYTQAKANATMAELQVSAKEAEIASIQQELNLINSAHVSAQIGYNISFHDYNTVFEQTKSKIPLVQLYDTHGVSQLLRIQQLSFNVTVTTETPIAFPVLMSYDTPYSSQSNQRTTVINFEAPKELTLRSIAEDLVSQIMEGGVGRKRSVNKRQAGTGGTLVSTFQRRCSNLMNLQDYFEQLLTAVNMTKNQTEASTDVISMITSQTRDTFSAFSSEEVNTASTLGARAMAALASLASQREESGFTEWQNSMGMLHNDTGTVAGYDCFGFADCLHTALSILQRILVDTPLDEAKQLLQQLRESRQGVEQLGVYKNLTLDDAESRLLEIADIVNDTDALDYWCAGLPDFTKQPPAEVNISIASTLRLVTTVESILPIRYRWKKDGIILNGQHSSILELRNIQMVDSGEYICLATTDTGTVPSLSSIVNVYYAPVFNRTLTSAVVREGEDNGVNFECDAHSWPPPGWSWYFRPNSSVEWEQIADTDSNLLPLLNPRLENEGWYRCAAHNWIGRGNRDAYLTILPATVVRINYPVRFRLMMTDEEISGNGASKEGSGSGSGMKEVTFGDSLNHSLTVQLTLTTTQVEGAIFTGDNMVLDLTFNFITPNFEFENIAEMTVDDILQEAGPSMMNLESDKIRLETALRSRGLYVDHQNIRYRTINGSLSFGTRAFVCPEGYGLHSSLVLCGELL